MEEHALILLLDQLPSSDRYHAFLWSPWFCLCLLLGCGGSGKVVLGACAESNWRSGGRGELPFKLCSPQNFVTLYVNQSILYLISLQTQTNFNIPAFLLVYLSSSKCFLYRKIFFRCVDCFPEDYTHRVYTEQCVPSNCAPSCLPVTVPCWLSQSLGQRGSALAMMLYFMPGLLFVLFSGYLAKIYFLARTLLCFSCSYMSFFS